MTTHAIFITMKYSIFFFLLFAQVIFSQSFDKTEIQINKLLTGDLYHPKHVKNPQLAIIVAGSGMTDRNCNAPGLKTDAYKLLAEALADEYAVFTYDKRAIVLVKSGEVKDVILTFDDFVRDLEDVVSYFRQRNYQHITLIGHSEGALLSILAAQKDADALVSLTGAGRPIDEILYDQLMIQLSQLENEILNILGSLKNQTAIEVKNPFLAGVFGKHNQPFLMNWMQYDPQKELNKVKVPTLIIGAGKDIQVSESEATLLSFSNDDALVEILPNMTHVLKNITNDNDQMKTYNDPTWPIADDLVIRLKTFLKSGK